MPWCGSFQTRLQRLLCSFLLEVGLSFFPLNQALWLLNQYDSEEVTVCELLGSGLMKLTTPTWCLWKRSHHAVRKTNQPIRKSVGPGSQRCQGPAQTWQPCEGMLLKVGPPAPSRATCLNPHGAERSSTHPNCKFVSKINGGDCF